jgi:deazaflavin-dependent oxidoreductase (nitroreductase family)
LPGRLAGSHRRFSFWQAPVMAMRVTGWWGRRVQRMATSPRFARVAPAIVPKVDRFVSRISGGRFTTSSGMVPSMVLITTGARSGQERETPLATIPDGDAFFVVGSNFAKPVHPAWSYNLLAHPDAIVVYRGRRIPVTARLLDDGEKAEAWPRLTAIWPVYDTYEDRTERALRVFELRPR